MIVRSNLRMCASTFGTPTVRTWCDCDETYISGSRGQPRQKGLGPRPDPNTTASQTNSLAKYTTFLWICRTSTTNQYVRTTILDVDTRPARSIRRQVDVMCTRPNKLWRIHTYHNMVSWQSMMNKKKCQERRVMERSYAEANDRLLVSRIYVVVVVVVCQYYCLSLPFPCALPRDTRRHLFTYT